MRCRIHGPVVVLMCILSSTECAHALPPSPLLGVWKLDTARLALPPRARPPKSVLLTVAASGEKRLTVVIRTINADGSARRAESSFKLDGTATSVSDTAGEMTTVSVTCPNDRTMIWATSINGHPTDTHVFTLSQNGLEETETIVGTGPDGQPHTRTNSWTRVASAHES